jgi:DNA-binding NarL/FixJ family response regulator
MECGPRTLFKRLTCNWIRTELLKSICAVHLGRRYIPQKIAAELAEHYSEDDLSLIEMEVLREAARGTSN